jgi:tetratricopeptide (TPR) repeat protein
MKAEMATRTGKYSEAIPFYKEHLTKNPKDIEVRTKLGFAYLKTAQLDEAVKEFKEVLEEEPGNSLAILYLGQAYLNKEDFPGAINTWQHYSDKERPLVEEEVKRLLTLLRINQSQRLAEQALDQEEELMAVVPDRKTVAVCYFDDMSPDKSLRAFQKGLAAMVIDDLAKLESVKVVDRLRIQALLEEMKLGKTGIVEPRDAPRVGRILGAESLIVGSLTKGSLQVATSVTSTRLNDLKGSSTVKVAEEQFYDLPAQIVSDFAKLNGIRLSEDELRAVTAPHTKNLEAFLAYGQALDAFDEGRWQDARNLFTEAVRLDPDFALARESRDSSLADDAPTLENIRNMQAGEMVSLVNSRLHKVQRAEKEALLQAQVLESGGGAGGGGGGGGGG